MASAYLCRNADSSASSMRVKPSATGTVSGSAYCVRSVSGLSSEASRRSTGLITCRLNTSTSRCVSAPSSMYTSAVRTAGRSHCAMSCMHCAAESARWSNCPGRYSEANTTPSPSGSSSYTSSSCGSENTVARARANSAASSPSTS